MNNKHTNANAQAILETIKTIKRKKTLIGSMLY